MGKKKKIKKLQRRLEEFEGEKPQTRNYLLWGAMLVLGKAFAVIGGSDPAATGNRLSTMLTKTAQFQPLMYLGGTHHNHNGSKPPPREGVNLAA